MPFEAMRTRVAVKPGAGGDQISVADGLVVVAVDDLATSRGSRHVSAGKARLG